MNQSTNTGGLDKFRLAGALLVVAIHTSPLTCISAEADFFLTRILARVAVPFFLMVTGQFVLPASWNPASGPADGCCAIGPRRYALSGMYPAVSAAGNLCGTL